MGATEIARNEALKKLFSYRQDVEGHIMADMELRELYLNDSCFKVSIDHAIHENMMWEEAVVFALKNGYKFKQEVFDRYVECQLKCTKPLQIRY